jgi:lipopolysaccharide export system ATP-binding protein
MLFAQNLSKTYADYSVVNNISLFLRRGETVALVGPGGAGKTTMFRMLIGIDQPTSGRITFDDVDITEFPVYERARLGLSYLPQQPSLIRALTVEKNLLLALETREPSASRRRMLCDELLSIFGIQHVRTARSGHVSGGERRRCEIARAMATRPKCLMLDEPFAGLDPLGISDMRKIINLVTEREIGVLITDHNVRETLSFVDRAYLIESGRILAEGTPDAIIADPEVRRAYLGTGFSL